MDINKLEELCREAETRDEEEWREYLKAQRRDDEFIDIVAFILRYELDNYLEVLREQQDYEQGMSY